jgi:hypothetical protein
VEGFLAMNREARDQVAFPGAAFRQTVDVLIRQNGLLSSVIPFARGELRLSDIRCPYLVYCEHDSIVPAPSSEPLTRLVASEDASELRLNSGHVGLVAGRTAAKVARPQITDFIRAPQRERRVADGAIHCDGGSRDGSPSCANHPDPTGRAGTFLTLHSGSGRDYGTEGRRFESSRARFWIPVR